MILGRSLKIVKPINIEIHYSPGQSKLIEIQN